MMAPEARGERALTRSQPRLIVWNGTRTFMSFHTRNSLIGSSEATNTVRCVFTIVHARFQFSSLAIKCAAQALLYVFHRVSHTDLFRSKVLFYVYVCVWT